LIYIIIFKAITTIFNLKQCMILSDKLLSMKHNDRLSIFEYESIAIAGIIFLAIIIYLSYFI